jgi:hypothetical protein
MGDPMSARAYCDRDHPGSDAEADDWCARYHRVQMPRVPRRSYPHRDGADLWTCPCLECVRLDWEASGEPGSFRAFLAQAREALAE